MGPNDPFSSRPEPPADLPNGTGDPAEPVRIQARLPDAPTRPRSRALAVPMGAAAGLAVGLLFVLLTPGQALLVLILTGLGAALGAIVKRSFGDGVDVEAAWRALRRR